MATKIKMKYPFVAGKNAITTTNISPAILPPSLCEYLLIIAPPKALYDIIRKEKNTFQEKYQAGFSGKPHITLVKFCQQSLMEEKIVRRLKNIASAFRPFFIEIDGFGSFPTHTIYFNVTTKNTIRKLVKSIRPVQPFLKWPDIDPHFITEPHITLTRKLLSWQYEKGWQEYKNLHFTGKFLADHMVLLKRQQGNKYYETVSEFYFLQQNFAPVQGNLFQ